MHLGRRLPKGEKRGVTIPTDQPELMCDNPLIQSFDFTDYIYIPEYEHMGLTSIIGNISTTQIHRMCAFINETQLLQAALVLILPTLSLQLHSQGCQKKPAFQETWAAN